ncbi:MAG: N-acetyltransferase family protein, partial [Planctomycetota bacterium]
GYAYASPHRVRAAYQWSVEVSAYVHEEARGRGVGRKLYAALFEALRRLGYVNAYAGVTLPNDASERFHAACGFEPVGIYRRVGYKAGAWHDVAWSQLRLQEPADPPAAPRLLSNAQVRAEVEALLRARDD